MKKRLLTMLAAAAVGFTAMNAQAPKRELRSTWMATVWAIDWPAAKTEAAAKKQMAEYLDDLAAHNFNGICFQVRGLADAVYRSSYEPWNSVLTGTRGKDPGWDPLEWVVEQCHERGMECYAWVNPYRESSSGAPYSTPADQQWLKDGWLLSNGSYIVFNPGMPETRAHILKVIKEIYTNYAIDGMLFDDYFYPSGGTVENSSAPDWDLYKASGTKLSIGDWRRKNINDFMKEIYDNIQEDRPDMRFGISPAGVAGKSSSIWGTPGVPVPSGDWQYDQIYSDPIAWLHDGAVDFVSPQLYWLTTHPSAPFGPLTNWWSQVANTFGRHFYASHSVSLLASESNSVENWADIARQVTMHRQSQAYYDNEPGNIFYSAKNLDGHGAGGVGGVGEYLHGGVYSTPALVPTIDWKDRPTYAPVADARLDGNTLRWKATAPAEGNSVIRYTVYAVESSTSFDRVQAANGDGIDISRLVGVTYKPEFELPAELARGHYFAVCVYDGYGFESQPAMINYNSEPSKATTLTAPANGSVLEGWECTFKWSEIPGATYELEIGADANFERTVELRRGLTGTSLTVDLSSLRGASTYYWRVFTIEPDRIGSSSEVSTFITPSRPVGNFEQGYEVMTDPANYAQAGEFEISSLWYRSIQPEFNNFPVIETGGLNRGMVATKDWVYVSGRSMVSAEADLYLQVYNALTGEHERDLKLSEDGRCGYLPCNDIIKDSEGNLMITNLSLNITTTPLNLYMVDTETGDLSLVASLTASGEGRVDHAGVYGNVESGNFVVFAALANSDRVLRWYVVNGTPEKGESVTLRDFCPAWATSTGIAPKVFPISESEFYLDGGATSAALYSFSTGRIIDCPAGNDPHYNDNTAANGFDYFVLGGKTLAVFAAGSHERDGYRFNISQSNGKKVLAGGSLLWSVPEGTLGFFNSSTFSAPVSAVDVDNNHARVYFYVPGNGLAAYQVTRKVDGLRDIAADGRGVWVYGNTVVFDTPREFIRAYSLDGSLVASESNATEASLPGAGTWVVVTEDGARKVTVK